MNKFKHIKNIEKVRFKLVVIRGRALSPVEKSPPRGVEVGVGVERWVEGEGGRREQTQTPN